MCITILIQKKYKNKVTRDFLVRIVIFTVIERI